jgi:hypothetical protein
MDENETPLAVWQATCEALEVPPGARRLDAFLRLPESTQDAIWKELADAAELQRAEAIP